MMKLANINVIKLGNPRTTTDKVAKAVPYSYPQRQRAKVGDDEYDEDEDEDVEDIERSQSRQAEIIQMSNSWAPFRDAPDIRKPPNKPDTIGA